MRRRRVAARAADGDREAVPGGVQRPRPEVDRPGRVARGDVDRERASHRPEPAVGRDLEQALLEHEPRAMPAFLPGLEGEEDASRQPGAPFHQESRGAQQHRDVRVVPAGVHRAVDLRHEVEPGRLLDRQRVHVGPEEDRRSGRAAVDQRSDGLSEPETRVRPGRGAPRRSAPGVGQLETDLGPPMKAAGSRRATAGGPRRRRGRAGWSASAQSSRSPLCWSGLEDVARVRRCRRARRGSPQARSALGRLRPGRGGTSSDWRRMASRPMRAVPRAADPLVSAPSWLGSASRH
jgi:hypothetical protein